jgi:pimeloyl-ACP methyl ester carboxylesterase
MQIESVGATLDVEVQGEGQPLLLVHGFPDTKRLWSKMVPHLVGAGFQVITYDQRGYGASDKPAEVEAYSIPFLANDVTAVLDGLGIEKAHLAGHDWGAAVVWAAATFAPDRVDHLIAMSVGHPSAFGAADMAQRQKSWYMLLFQWEGIAEEWLMKDDAANFYDWCHHPDFRAVLADLERDKSLTPGLNYYRANVPPAALTGPPLELPPIQAPTMGIWSSNDFALNVPQMFESAKYCVYGFRYERIDGVDHWMQWEAPERVTPLFLDFLPR